MRISSERTQRWGIVLAGGDGVRLRPLTRLICGDDRPKQFCALYGGMTLLEQARRRAQQSIPAGQILFSLAHAHEEFYLRDLADCPSQRIVQPRNRGTAAAILSSLLLIARKDPNATVAVFPSDHHYSDENVIAEAVENAFALSRREPDSVILVGARPHGSELEYGWIEVGQPALDRRDSFRVRGFHEKPSLPLARLLLEQGSLWNTFVMVGKVLAFLEMTCSAMPGVLRAFQQYQPVRASNQELRIPDSFYAGIPSADFSRQVLSLETQRLIVQQLGPVTWSDLGDCERALAALSHCGGEPEWATSWRAMKPPASAMHHASLAALA
ncbi:MAG: putative Nucleotidyl transferase [Bryobacterales bacterium]|nr:putative Nucleotidyl transferase [Bryobacterales bacterium]